MKGVSEVIAIILILMITIAIAGLAYTFMSSTMASTTSAASSAVDTTTSSMMTAFTIENMDVAKVYLRNTGQNTLSSLSVYVNDEPAIFSITPTTIAPGQIGTITIYSFIPEGATVKVVSSNGFSTSKVATPCSRAVGCWKFDEGSGTTAYDSSPYGNSGTINGANWMTNKYGNALLFDGSNDYINFGNSNILRPLNEITISALVNIKNDNDYETIVSLGYTSNYLEGVWLERHNNNKINFRLFNTSNSQFDVSSNTLVNSTSGLTYIVAIWNGTIMRLSINGILESTYTSFIGQILYNESQNNLIGIRSGASYPFNGTIDEVRIYDRSIY